MTSAARRCVIFDLGGVLIDWNPRHLYRTLTPDTDAIEGFVSDVCSHQCTESLDAGPPWSDDVAELVARAPGQRSVIEAHHFSLPVALRDYLAGIGLP